MTTLVAKIGDRMLGLLLKEHTAAAACHKNYNKGCGCSGNRHKRYDCAGVCRVTQLGCVE